MPRFVKKRGIKIPAPLTLREFHEKRNKVLILRETGGLGDMLIHRMIFEDFKKIMPEAEITLACRGTYSTVMEDHPYIDKIVDCRKTDPFDWIVHYNTTSACTKYEIAMAPFSGLHRSDIWAQHCGVVLKNHNMHLKISSAMKEAGKKFVGEIWDGKSPKVLFCPISAMKVKDLLPEQIAPVVQYLKNKGCFVYSTNKYPIPELNALDVPTIYNISYKDWIGVVNEADYVITVDTSHFHLAGELKKPLVGIFTFADGIVYGRYFKFELVQKHRSNGDWDCGPCYNWANCKKSNKIPKPCLTEITPKMIIDAIDRMFAKYPIKNNIH
jgi:ADP-heptose:LPS heptosyltransferase